MIVNQHLARHNFNYLDLILVLESRLNVSYNTLRSDRVYLYIYITTCMHANVNCS